MVRVTECVTGEGKVTLVGDDDPPRKVGLQQQIKVNEIKMFFSLNIDNIEGSFNLCLLHYYL